MQTIVKGGGAKAHIENQQKIVHSCGRTSSCGVGMSSKPSAGGFGSSMRPVSRINMPQSFECTLSLQQITGLT